MAKRKRRKKQFKHSYLARWWRRYEYKHSTVAVAAIGGFVLALDTTLVQSLLGAVEDMGILGIFIAGLLFVSFFTAAPAVVMLTSLADNFNPLTIAFYGAMGSAVGDWIILRFFEEKVAYELAPLAKKWKLMPLIRKLRRRKARERTTLLGMVAIASPLPDELGIALLGISHLPTVSLLIITTLLNGAGILVIVLLAA
jgi:membrane protein YqaA with SNARE-associated domain